MKVFGDAHYHYNLGMFILEACLNPSDNEVCAMISVRIGSVSS